jgi:hypothetical protein
MLPQLQMGTPMGHFFLASIIVSILTVHQVKRRRTYPREVDRILMRAFGNLRRN